MTYTEVVLLTAAKLARLGRASVAVVAGMALAWVALVSAGEVRGAVTAEGGMGVLLGLAAGLSPLLLLVPWIISHRPAHPAERLTVPAEDLLPAAWAADIAGPSDPMNAMLLRLSLLEVVQLQTAETRPPRYALGLRVTQTHAPLPTDLTGARELLAELGLHAGTQRILDQESIADGKTVRYVDDRLTRLAARAACERGWVTPSIAGVVGYGLVLLLPLAALAIATFFDDTGLALGLAIAGLAGAFVDTSMLFTWSPEGRRVREQSQALRAAIRTGGLVSGMPEATRLGTFETLLPWAAAFGLVGEWIENSRVPRDTADPVGVWASAALGATAVAEGALTAAKAKRDPLWWLGEGGGN